MSRAIALGVFDAIMVLRAVTSPTLTSVHSQGSCPTGIANFGDSLTDTGNLLDATPYMKDPENPPYGASFFGAPAKRFCNGRLVPDFFAQAFSQPLLDAYFAVASFNYVQGINFAVAGATAANVEPPLATPFSLTPFQTNQFIRFQRSTIATQAQPGCVINVDLPVNNPFSDWLYTITAGGNDLLLRIEDGVPISFVNDTIVPQVVAAVVEAIRAWTNMHSGLEVNMRQPSWNLSDEEKTLYNVGARQFLIYGVPAGGCATFILTYLRPYNYPKDDLGCIIPVNSVAQNFNAQLLSEIRSLRKSLAGSSIAFFDYYKANIAIASNPTAFGFNSTVTTTACCGAPGNGTLNFNPDIICGNPSLGSNVCANPDEYIYWDGMHFTEAFYRYIAYLALHGLYTDGGINYAASCDLDFTMFPSGITFEEAYPLQTCNNLFT